MFTKPLPAKGGRPAQTGRAVSGVLRDGQSPAGDGRWHSVLEDRARQCHAAWLPGALDREAARALLSRALVDTVRRSPPGGRSKNGRLTAWLTRDRCTCPYPYGGGVAPSTGFATMGD